MTIKPKHHDLHTGIRESHAFGGYQVDMINFRWWKLIRKSE